MIPKYKKIEKHSWQNIFFSILLGSLILLVVGSLFLANFRMSRKRAILNSQIDQLKEEIQVMQEKKQQLEAQVYQSGQAEYLEKEARETFNLKKPGEEVVTILPQKEEPKQAEKIKKWWDPFSW
ncbi:MAG: septum formation initiator family protein [Candidatus Nealsonbacteria bacterium]|nr:septum formation initiator family protein [Candidatus Nealsonbacteria bacterium]